MFIGDHGAFIELVRSRPILYDSSNPDYRDADKKKSSWLEVISEWDSVSGEKNSRKYWVPLPVLSGAWSKYWAVCY